MFRASSAHLQEDVVVYKQHMVPSLSIRVPGGLSIGSYDRPPGLLQRVTVPYAACIQLCPPEDEHLILETCTGIHQ